MGIGFDSKCNFTPPSVLLGLLLCPWTWGIFLGGIFQDGGVEGCVLTFSCKNSEITTHCWTTIDRRLLDPTKKRPHIQGQRRNPSKMVGGVKLHLESNPLPTRYAQRAQINLVHTLHRDPTETDQNCVWVSPAKEQISSGLLQGQGHLVQQTWVWHKPSWRRSPLTSP